MSSSQDFSVYKTLPYNVYARAAGKWDYLQENQFFNSSQTVNISMTDYNGLSMRAKTQYESALPLDFSNTVLPWKWDYYNYLLENNYCFMPTGHTYEGIIEKEFNSTDWNIQGDVTITNDFIASNFGVSNVILCNNEFSPASNTWEIGTKFKYVNGSATVRVIGTGSQYGGFGFSVNSSNHPVLYLGMSTTSWNIANTTNNNYTLTNNGIYSIKARFTGSAYIVTITDDDWATSTEIFNISSYSRISSFTPRIGKASGQEGTSYWRGDIYLADTYIKLNGEFWSRVAINGTFSRPGCTYNYVDDGSAVTLNCFVVNGDEYIVLTPDNSYTNGYLLGTVSIPAHTVYTYSETTAPWTQPTLSADGTMGGSSFAVATNSTYWSQYAYYAFDGNSSTYWKAATNTSIPQPYLEFYNPEAIVVTNIAIKNYTDTSIIPIDYEFQYSDDDATWTTLTSGTNTNTTAGGEWNFNVIAGSHKYWRFVIKSTTGNSNMGIGAAITEMTITAHTSIGTWTAE